jgi:hypothetical protein
VRLLVALDAPPGYCRGQFSISFNKAGLWDRLFNRSVLGGDIKQFLSGIWLIAAEFMH